MVFFTDKKGAVMNEPVTQDKKSELDFYKRMYSNLKDLEDGHCITHGYEEVYTPWKDSVKRGLLLDVGSGTGKHSLNLAKMGFRVVGVELSMEGIRAARALGKEAGVKILFIRGDVENLPFKDRTFDVSFCGLILHHFKNPDKAIEAIGRVTRSHMIAFETNALEPLTYIKFNLINRFIGISKMSSNQRALFPGRLRRGLGKLGFSDFKFSWIDIHREYGGAVGKVLNLYTSLSRLFPPRFRANKFVMSCRRERS
jgi:SAM-dependent methyltransferase